MAPTSLVSIKFINSSLSCTSPLTQSYKESKQRRIIRKHLISLVKEFESFVPSIDSFTYNNGATVNLLNVDGFLHVSSSTPSIPLTIWIDQNYPHSPPLVFLSTISHYHPYIDSTGFITSPYLTTWAYPRSNLLDLVCNFVHLFSHHHPFFSSTSSSMLTTSTHLSRMEAIDCLVAKLHVDVVNIESKVEQDIEVLTRLQAELVDRSDILTSIMLGIEYEKSSLEKRVRDMTEETDVLMNWMRVHDPNEMRESMFEAEEEASGEILDNIAAEEAIEDVVYALDKAMAEGVISLGDYLKQVRILSREQFFCKAKLVHLRSSDLVQY